MYVSAKRTETVGSVTSSPISPGVNRERWTINDGETLRISSSPGPENHNQLQLSFLTSGGQSTQIKYLSKSTDTYTKILLQ